MDSKTMEFLLNTDDNKEGAFSDIIEGLEKAYGINIDENKLVSLNSNIANSKSEIAKYIKRNGKIPKEYIKIKGEVDEKYERIEARLFSNV